MVRFLKLTYWGECAVHQPAFRDFFNQWDCLRTKQPNLYEQLSEGALVTYILPKSELLDTLPKAGELLTTVVYVPSFWDLVTRSCYDFYNDMELPPLSSRLRHGERPNGVPVQTYPFSGDPLDVHEVRKMCRMLQRKPLNAFDTVAFVKAFASAPRPICAIGSVFIIEKERYILSFEDDEYGLPIVVFRRERYLPTRMFVPVYVP